MHILSLTKLQSHKLMGFFGRVCVFLLHFLRNKKMIFSYLLLHCNLKHNPDFYGCDVCFQQNCFSTAKHGVINESNTLFSCVLKFAINLE